MPVSTRYADTDPRALEVFIELHRRMTPSQKLAAVFEMSEMLLRMSLADVKRQHPNASEREAFLRMAARHLDRDLMLRAYGWHPDLSEQP